MILYFLGLGEEIYLERAGEGVTVGDERAQNRLNGRLVGGVITIQDTMEYTYVGEEQLVNNTPPSFISNVPNNINDSLFFRAYTAGVTPSNLEIPSSFHMSILGGTTLRDPFMHSPKLGRSLSGAHQYANVGPMEERNPRIPTTPISPLAPFDFVQGYINPWRYISTARWMPDEEDDWRNLELAECPAKLATVSEDCGMALHCHGQYMHITDEWPKHQLLDCCECCCCCPCHGDCPPHCKECPCPPVEDGGGFGYGGGGSGCGSCLASGGGSGATSPGFGLAGGNYYMAKFKGFGLGTEIRPPEPKDACKNCPQLRRLFWATVQYLCWNFLREGQECSKKLPRKVRECLIEFCRNPGGYITVVKCTTTKDPTHRMKVGGRGTVCRRRQDPNFTIFCDYWERNSPIYWPEWLGTVLHELIHECDCCKVAQVCKSGEAEDSEGHEALAAKCAQECVPGYTSGWRTGAAECACCCADWDGLI